jgi:uncharacterized protein (DUF302 family)
MGLTIIVNGTPHSVDVDARHDRAGLLTRAKIFALTALMCLWGVQAMAADGLTTIPSSHGPKDTMNRLEVEVKAKGMTVFARIDHAAGAAAVGLSLRPTELLIFGNGKGGTPLMQSNQTIGIDLPLKALVWGIHRAPHGSRTTIRVGSPNGTGSAARLRPRSAPSLPRSTR